MTAVAPPIYPISLQLRHVAHVYSDGSRSQTRAYVYAVSRSGVSLRGWSCPVSWQARVYYNLHIRIVALNRGERLASAEAVIRHLNSVMSVRARTPPLRLS